MARGRPKKAPEDKAHRLHMSIKQGEDLEVLKERADRLGITIQEYLKAAAVVAPYSKVKRHVG